MATYVEHVPENPNVRAITIVGENAVYYAVEARADRDAEWVTKWDTRVDFGNDKRHRAGGAAFNDAACMQETRLKGLAQ